MTVPEDFELDPVKSDSFPEPTPPRIQKFDIYADSVDLFKNIDDHAVAVSSTDVLDFFFQFKRYIYLYLLLKIILYYEHLVFVKTINTDFRTVTVNINIVIL